MTLAALLALGGCAVLDAGLSGGSDAYNQGKMRETENAIARERLRRATIENDMLEERKTDR